jgi:pyridoxamine 5'-phosphate oxidase
MCSAKNIRDLSEQRQEYRSVPLDDNELDRDPFKQFDAWYQQAVAENLVEPNAMVLATVSPAGHPSQRTVLLKYFGETGFVFFTNYESRKARQIDENENVSLLFQWLPLNRQLEINGRTEKISAAESLRYFLARPRGSQLGAWVSQQSSVITSRSLLEQKFFELKQKFAAGKIPIPSFWGGFRVIPQRFEFWQGGANRLHDRFEYLRQDNDEWILQRLAP